MRNLLCWALGHKLISRDGWLKMFCEYPPGDQKIVCYRCGKEFAIPHFVQAKHIDPLNEARD